MIRFAFILLVFFSTLSRAEGISPSPSQEAFASINRNVTDTEEELRGRDIKPLHVALPINSIRQIWIRAGWIKDDPVIQDEKDWKDKFKEDSAKDGMTPEEADQILRDVDNEFGPLEDEINQKFAKAEKSKDSKAAADAIFANLMLQKAKAEKAEAHRQEHAEKKAKTAEAREEASKQKNEHEKKAENSKQEAKQSVALRASQMQKLKKEIEKERKRLTEKGDLQGMEYLDAIEKLFKDLPISKNKDAFFKVCEEYADRDDSIPSLGYLMTAPFAGGAGNFIRLMLTKIFKDKVEKEYNEWKNGGGENSRPSDATSEKRSLKSRLKAARLPIEGTFRYVPPKNYHPSEPLPRGENRGFIDQFGNEWVPGDSRTPGEDKEWDVQLGKHATEGFRKASKDGRHVNISLKGRVTH